MRVGVGVCERVVPCFVIPCIDCIYCPHPLTVVPAQCLSLGSSPALLLTLGWCSLCIAVVIGDGVAVVGCAVVIGVLLGVGCSPARRNIISALKMERKNNSRVGPEGVTSQPRYWSPLWSPVPTIVAPPGCCSRCHCRLGPVSVVVVISIIAAPHESLMLSWFSFTLHTSSLFVNNR